MKNKLRKALGREIAIEYKACLYFCCILFFECAYLFILRADAIPMLHMWEMIWTAYGIAYLQVYLFDSFDEAERLGPGEIARLFVCTVLYTIVSLVFNWFGKNLWVTVLFFVFIILMYLCVFLCNKIKRRIDTENLNAMLETYKKGEAHE